MSDKITTFHIIGERPTSVEIDGVEREIPDGWLIFNAPRPLYASPIEVVVREAMTIDEYDYPEVRDEIYIDWNGDFRHGRFYVAVDPDDDDRIKRNCSLDGWALEYHSIDEATDWAVKFYGERYGISEDEVREHDPSDYVRNFLDHFNEDI